MELKYHSFIRNLIEKIDSINDEHIVFWRNFPESIPQEKFVALQIPLPFKEGDILCLHFPNNDSETEDLTDKPLLIRRFEKKSISNVIDGRVFTNEFTYFKYDSHCDGIVEYVWKVDMG